MRDIEKRISDILRPVVGRFGLVAWNLGSDERIAMNGGEAFQSASVIKVPLMVELFHLSEQGTLDLCEVIVLRDEYKVDGSGVLKEMHDGLPVTIRDLIALMIVVSDNTATNMLIDRIGMDGVNARMKSLGLTDTILVRRMYDWEAAKAGRENRCTASDMALLLKLIAEGSIPSSSTSAEMVEIMARQQYRDKIPLLLPTDTRVANKTGSLTGVTHDVGIVYAPAGPYVLSVLTSDVPDVHTAEHAIAQVSELVYTHFS